MFPQTNAAMRSSCKPETSEQGDESAWFRINRDSLAEKLDAWGMVFLQSGLLKQAASKWISSCIFAASIDNLKALAPNVAAQDWVDAGAELIKPYLSGGKLRALAKRLFSLPFQISGEGMPGRTA